MKKFWKENGLSIVFVLLFLVCLLGQIIAGWKELNNERVEEGQEMISLSQYLHKGHFLQATFENWESEFLQMGLFVVLVVSLRQKGSSESKSFEKEEVDREPDPKRKGAPWPVKKGGLVLFLYKNSLFIVYTLLFVVSFIMHFYGSLKDYNEEQLEKGLNTAGVFEYLGNPRFWFESMQNWQSEFLAVLSLVTLTIFLRQKGSPQSKPVDAPHDETGV